MHHRDFAEFTGAYNLNRFLKMLATALLETDGDDALVFSCGMHHRQPFRHIMRGGLLTIHMLARFTGVNRDAGVPVVGRGDNHGVDIFALQQASVVRDKGQVGAPCHLGELVALFFVHIRRGDNLAPVGEAAEHAIVIASNSTASDNREPNPLVGASFESFHSTCSLQAF